MSKNNIINNNETLSESQIKSDKKYININLSNELNNHNLNLASIESENIPKKQKNLHTIPQQNEIDLLKQNLAVKPKTNINPYKKEIYKENTDQNMNPYKASNKLKEQKILELLEIINQYESQISSLNNQIKFLTNNNKQMKEIIKNIEFGYEQTKVNLMTEKEVNKNNNTYMNNLYQDKIISEEKIKELINIIFLYSKKIDELKKTLNEIKSEIILYKKENEEYKTEINQLNEKIILLDNENKELKVENVQLKEDNKKLCEIQYNTENKIKKNLKEYENIKIQIKINENKYSNLIYIINQDLKSLSKYFENKYNTFLLDNKEINDNENEIKLYLLCFQNCDENNNKDIDINIQLLIKTLINGFNDCKEKIKDLKIKNNNINDKLSSIINKEKDYTQQIEILNKTILEKEKLIKQFDNEIFDLKKEITNNKKSKINNINNNLILEKKIEMLNSEIKLKEDEMLNINKIIKMKDDNIDKLKNNNKKLIQDNINLIKELKKFNKKIKY